MRIGLMARDMSPENLELARAVLARMRAAGLETLPAAGLAGQLRVPEALDPSDLEDVDLWVGLGGDGTLLDMVAQVGRGGVPVLGINLGRLGFLSSVRIEDLDGALAALKTGRYAVQERSLLEVTDHHEVLGAVNFALNEVSISKRDSASMVALHVHLDNDFLNTYWADGLIVATPTGSTAYSLSCGGPILHPTSNALVINPISPHNLNVRPYVIPDHFTIRVRLEARADKCLLNLDARSVAVDGDATITIRRAPFDLKLVQLEGQDPLDTLRNKLNWGLDHRSASR
jgi:NAD+ kinase